MMSDNEKPRRNAAVLLGALAVGAVLSAAMGVTAEDTPIGDQFRSAFTPGTVRALECNTQIVVSDG